MSPGEVPHKAHQGGPYAADNQGQEPARIERRKSALKSEVIINPCENSEQTFDFIS